MQRAKVRGSVDSQLQVKRDSIPFSGMKQALRNIRDAIWRLPKPIQKVCIVQLFAFMAWYVINPTVRNVCSIE